MGCRGSSESTLVKMPHCWKSHVTAYFENKENRRQLFLKITQHAKCKREVNNLPLLTGIGSI